MVRSSSGGARLRASFQARARSSSGEAARPERRPWSGASSSCTLRGARGRAEAAHSRAHRRGRGGSRRGGSGTRGRPCRRASRRGGSDLRRARWARPGSPLRPARRLPLAAALRPVDVRPSLSPFRSRAFMPWPRPSGACPVRRTRAAPAHRALPTGHRCVHLSGGNERAWLSAAPRPPDGADMRDGHRSRRPRVLGSP